MSSYRIMLHVEHYLVCTCLEICLRAKPVIVVQDGQAQISGSIVLMLILSKSFGFKGPFLDCEISVAVLLVTNRRS